MKKKDIIALADLCDDDITICNILEAHNGCIRFAVDEGLPLPTNHLETENSNDIILTILRSEQIDASIAHLVTNGVKDCKVSYLGKDIMFQTFLTCFAEHRPLVLSPDTIWLLILQTIARHIDNHPERYRTKFVNFKDSKELIVSSEEDIFDKKLNWDCLLQDMYEQIATNTKENIASTLYSNFSTTTSNERIASIATLMGTLKTYFRYQIIHYICGIPYIELLGTVNDWEDILQKSVILKKLGMTSWHEWLHPILKEFVRAVKGKPNLKFWQSIVMLKREDDFSLERECWPPNYDYINGWCIALFPYLDGNRRRLERCLKFQTMDNEMTRTEFLYHRIFPNEYVETLHMELWSGFIGVEENQDTYALTPKIGWFVRQSDSEAESIARLERQDNYRGVELDIDDKVPKILKKMHCINRLILTFKGKINLPEWLNEIEIEQLIVFGKVDKEERCRLKTIYKNIKINPGCY